MSPETSHNALPDDREDMLAKFQVIFDRAQKLRTLFAELNQNAQHQHSTAFADELHLNALGAVHLSPNVSLIEQQGQPALERFLSRSVDTLTALQQKPDKDV